MLVPRRPGVAYLDTHLWVPKTVGADVIRKLKRTFKYLLTYNEDGGPAFLYLWRESPHHLVVPRTATVEGVEPINLLPDFPRIEPRSNIRLDHLGGTLQQESLAAMLEAGGGILNLGCGKGKTIVLLEAVSRIRTPTLVVVHTSLLFKQWLSRIDEHLGQVSVGMIQGNPSTWSWDRDIVVAMLQTLYQNVNQLTPEIRKHFGIVVFDEAHRLPSEKYSVVADLFPGQRYGLTATTRRGDERQYLNRHHLGPVFYSNLEQISPTIYFQMVNFIINLKSPEVSPLVRDKNGQIHLGKVRTFIGKYEPRNIYLMHYILWLKNLGRQVLVLTHSRDQVYILRDMLSEFEKSDIGVCTGREDIDGREDVLNTNKIILATAHLASEGLDKLKLDTLLLLSPFGSEVSGSNALQQSMGRILRAVKGKDPVLVIIHDIGLSRFHRMCRAMADILKYWPKKKSGPLSYKYVPTDERPPMKRGLP